MWLESTPEGASVKLITEKDQDEGFTLAGTLELGGMHIVILEKAMEKAGG